MNLRNLIIISSLVTVIFVDTFQMTYAKEASIPNNNKVQIWTESLRLGDYYVLPNYTELQNALKKYGEVLTKHYDEHPSVFSAAIEYGLLLIDLGKLDEAKKVWERATKDFTNNDTPKVYRAWLDAIDGNYIASRDVWLPIIKQKLEGGLTGYSAGIWLPYHTDIVIGLYSIKDYLEGKDKEEVENIVGKIASQFQGNPKIGLVSVSIDIQEGNISSASTKAEKLLEIDPNDPTAITLFGITQLITHDYDGALKSFDLSATIKPNSPTNELMRARALHALKKKDESKIAVENAIKLDPIWRSKLSNQTKKLLDSKSYLSSQVKKETKKQQNDKEKEVKESKATNVPETY